jgi:DNA repair photolyase
MQTFSDLRGERSASADLPLFDAPATVRTFDTPEFRGITFYEVEAKSILNRVPPASRLGFDWTINVYRGCSHACSYCQLGDTSILMGDGRTKPLADVRPGDSVYGTVFDGKYRRYVITEVLDHWSTMKSAYRVALEDGTELVASADHRFLTAGRGWKHVTGTEHGRHRRPHLTVKNELLGTGQFAPQPEHAPEYRRGYLCGMIRGDGHIGSYVVTRGAQYSEIQSFRLALVDLEALRRTRDYLAELGIATREFVFQKAVGAGKAVHAIGTGARQPVATIKEIISWPWRPSDDWRKGFLGGIFDAEGSYSRGIIRISNTDELIIAQVATCLRRFGFTFAIEIQMGPEKKKPMIYVRLLGGVREHLRFFHTVDPAITRKRTIEGQAIKNDAPLRVTSIEPLGVDLPMYDITTGTGDFIANGVVSHNCFARPTHTYLNMGAGEDFERRIVVKVNAPEVLRRELRKRSWKGEHVAMGTNTDPYQRCEGRYRLTRGVLEVMRDYANPCSMLTKSPLLLRDLDLFTELADTAGFTANLSIGTLDEEVWRRAEPGTPHPRARMDAVKRLNQAGVPTGVLVAPILPGISDSPEQLREVVRAAAEAGASHISPITLHLRPGVKEEFMPWLEREYPELVEGYRRLYRGSNAPKATRESIAARVGDAKRRHPLPDRPERKPDQRAPGRLVPPTDPPEPQGDQLSLLD